MKKQMKMKAVTNTNCYFVCLSVTTNNKQCQNVKNLFQTRKDKAIKANFVGAVKRTIQATHHANVDIKREIKCLAVRAVLINTIRASHVFCHQQIFCFLFDYKCHFMLKQSKTHLSTV